MHEISTGFYNIFSYTFQSDSHIHIQFESH